MDNCPHGLSHFFFYVADVVFYSWSTKDEAKPIIVRWLSVSQLIKELMFELIAVEIQMRPVFFAFTTMPILPAFLATESFAVHRP